MTTFLRTIGSLPGIAALARALDIFGFMNQPTPYRHARNPEQADADAIAGDWRVVGDDLRRAAASLWCDTSDRT